MTPGEIATEVRGNRAAYKRAWFESLPEDEKARVRAERAAYQREWRLAHPEAMARIKERYREGHRDELRQRVRDYRAAHLEAQRTREREKARAKRVSFLDLSPEALEAVRRAKAEKARQQASQRGEREGRPRPLFCEACGGGGRICLDHCHQTERFRGWLCSGCNSALGHARDDPGVLRALANYLERECPEDPGD